MLKATHSRGDLRPLTKDMELLSLKAMNALTDFYVFADEGKSFCRQKMMGAPYR